MSFSARPTSGCTNSAASSCATPGATPSRRSGAPTSAQCSGDSAAGQSFFELLEHLHRRRVDAAQHGQVDRHEIARAAPAIPAARSGSRRSCRRDTWSRSVPAMIPRVSSIRWRMRGCRSESSRNTALKRAELGRSLPARDLVVVEFGQLAGEARHLRVLVDLALPAVGDRRGQPGAADLRHGPVQAARQPLGQAVLGRLRGSTRRPAARHARRRRRSPRAGSRPPRTVPPPRVRRPASRRPPRGAESPQAAESPARRPRGPARPASHRW